MKLRRAKHSESFLYELNEWWPKEYTWSQDKLKEIRIDGQKDGLCTEIGPYGFRCDWGRVTELTENEKIGLKWQISPKREPIPNPEKASDIEIVFSENSRIMLDKNYTISIVVDQSPEEVYNAINNVRSWWSEEIQGPTDELNKEWFYHYKDIHLCKIKVVAMEPGIKVVWKVMENSFSFIKDQEEWVGNHLIFDISKEGDKTKLNFTHEGLTEFYECYDVCREAWTNYLSKSLYKLITTGKGEPNPAEGEGYNKELADKWKLN